MPYTLSTFVLPDGRRCARFDWTGAITAKDADAVLADCEPGGAAYGLPALAVALNMTGMDSEARAIFSSPRRSAFQEKLALVIASPIFRVMANFVFRIQRNDRHRLFKTEVEGLAWLTEKRQ